MNSWKQPIPTSLNHIFGDDHVARHVYIELLLRARNANDENPEQFVNKLHFLERGQCVFGMDEMRLVFNRSRNYMISVVKRLIVKYNVITTEGTPNGTVATILNYDIVVGMKQRSEQRNEQRSEQRGEQRVNNVVNTNKSVKSEKSEKELAEVLAYFNSSFKKGFKATPSWTKNFLVWNKLYSLEEIKKAINSVKEDGWLWKDKNGKYIEPTLELLFRTKNKAGDCDYIGQILNRNSLNGFR